jgi:hypothetical protein
VACLVADEVQWGEVAEGEGAAAFAAAGGGDAEVVAAEDVVVDFVAELGGEAEEGGVRLIKQGAGAV